LEEEGVVLSQGVELQIPVGVRQPNVYNTLGVEVLVREEPQPVHDPDPAVAWRLGGVGRRDDAAHGGVQRRAVRSEMHVQLRRGLVEETQQRGEIRHLHSVGDAEDIKKLHVLVVVLPPRRGTPTWHDHRPKQPTKRRNGKR